MTQKEKQLLLIDLCARLPYHPQVKIYNDSWEGCKIGEFDNSLYYHHIEAFVCDRIEIKPYLRPMSSMTEEEKKNVHYFVESHKLGNCSRSGAISDYLNSIHIDYRGLIPMGLALEAKEGMYD